MMTVSDIHIGWEGKCKDHPTQNTIARPAPPPGTMKIFSCSMLHKCGRTMFGRVLEIHCATDHKYLAIDTREIIHDPFSETEDIECIVDEGWKIIQTARPPEETQQ